LYDVVSCAWLRLLKLDRLDSVDSATGFQTTFMGSLSQQLGRRHIFSNVARPVSVLVFTRKVKFTNETQGKCQVRYMMLQDDTNFQESDLFAESISHEMVRVKTKRG
jgi:hypothetical protein